MRLDLIGPVSQSIHLYKNGLSQLVEVISYDLIGNASGVRGSSKSVAFLARAFYHIDLWKVLGKLFDYVYLIPHLILDL
jgi:hypothetical protein